MKSSDRTILLVIGGLAIVAAFWFLLLSPKRDEASKLDDQVSELQTQVEAAELAATEGEEAKTGFSGNYRRIVSLGKAAPKDADTPSLLLSLQRLSDRSDVEFRSISLAEGTGAAATATAAPAAEPTATETTATGTDTATATPAGTTTAGATPTEATAALLPIGATVGPAGLPVMPYSLKFQGGFFDISDFFGRIDGMVATNGKKVDVGGRLLTIDAFSMEAGPDGFPSLEASVQATSYLAPADQGVTAGASPTAPATVAPTDATATTAPAAAAVTP